MKANNLKNKTLNLIRRIDLAGEKTWVKWLVFGIYTLILIAYSVQHEAWYDEYHVWSMVYKMNFTELWQSMRYEGHFCLWHLMMWPLVKWLNMDLYALLVVSVPLMLIAVYLILHRLQFPFIGKLLIIFTSIFLYYYPIVSRCYALIPPLLAAIAVLYQQSKYPFLYCLLLGLLANTHAYIEGLVAILWLLFVYDNVWQQHKTNRKAARRNMLAASITVVFVLIAFAQVVGGVVDFSHGHRAMGEGIQSPEKWLSIFYSGYHIQFFDVLHQHIHLVPQIDLILTLCSYIIVIICSFQVLRDKMAKRKQALLILFVSIAYQVLFATNIYGMNSHRIAMLYFCLLLVLWMYYYRTERKAYLYTLLLICLMLTTPLKFYYNKVKSPEPRITTFVRTTEQIVPADKTLYTNTLMGGATDMMVRDCSLWTEEIENECIISDLVDIYVISNKDTFSVSNCQSECIFDDSSLRLYHITK